jgi:uncharacterized DUF497 family protein
VPPDVVHELDVADVAREKLGRRGISVAEAKQLRWNRYEMGRNARVHGDGRRLMHGRTDGGRPLTLVLEKGEEAGSWIVVTGWEEG